MGGEFAQFIEWNYKQQLDWMLLDFPKHRGMFDYVRDLNHIYASTPALYRIDDSWDGFTWLNVDDSARSSVAFMRQGPALPLLPGLRAELHPVPYEDFVIGLPRRESSASS